MSRRNDDMQTITTPNGEKLVVLPIAEYERLVDQADIAEALKVDLDDLV